MERNETQTRSVKHGDWLPCQKSGQYVQAFWKKFRKTDSDRRTECKPILPFGFATFNPYYKPLFINVWSTSLLKILVMSNSPFPILFSTLLKNSQQFLSNIKLSANSFSLEESKICSLGMRKKMVIILSPQLFKRLLQQKQPDYNGEQKTVTALDSSPW